MTIKKKSFQSGVNLKPTTDALNDKGDIAYSSSDEKLKYKDNSATRTVVNTDESQTLTNKTISSATNTITVDADTATVSNLEVDNLKSGVLDTDLTTVSGADDTIPSAKAVKTYVDNKVATKDQASEISFVDSIDFPGTPSNVQDALDELNDKVDTNATNAGGDLSTHISDISTHGISVEIVGTTESQTLTNKTLTSPVVNSPSIVTPSRLDIKQDTEANLTTYALTASNGQLVFATDTKKVYHVKDTLLAEIGGGGSGGTSIEITQTSHGFAVGDGIYYNGSAWAKAQANSASTLARFTVFSVPSANQFVAYSFGRVTVTGHGFTVNNFYYLSPSTAGLPTLTEPTSASHYTNPLFYVESSNILIAFVYRPLKAATNLDDLADVSTTGATNGQALVFNGSSWSPSDVVQNAGDVIYDNSSSALTSIDVQSAIDEIDVDVDDLNTLSGVAKNAQNLGTFTGTTIADSSTIKSGMQALETYSEGISSSLGSHVSDTTTHGTTGDILGTSDAQVITNKDIDGGTAANTRRITVPKDTRANLDSLTRKAGTALFDTTNEDLLIDNGTGLFEVNTNGTKNYIKYSNADRTISNWNLYADAAQSTPENGTGGSATSTLTRSSSSPLRGLYSFLFSKPASNEQGEGFSYDFTIDSADKNTVLDISFDYDASNANYLDDYMSAFIYDVTNSQLIRFNGEEIKGRTNGKFLAFFQTSQSTSYRLIIHVVTSTTTAWDVKFDNFRIGVNSTDTSTSQQDSSVVLRTANGYGATNTKIRRFSNTITNIGSDVTYADSSTLGATFTVNNNGLYDINYTEIFGDSNYFGISRNSTQLTTNIISITASDCLALSSTGAANTPDSISWQGYLNKGDVIRAHGHTGSTGSNANIEAKFSINKIGKTNFEAEYSGRLIYASGAGNGGTSLTADTTNIDFTETSDTSSSFNGTTFTAPESGYYEFEGAIKTTASISGSIYTYINTTKTRLASSPAISTTLLHFSGKEYLTKGQNLTFRSDFSATLSNSTTDHHIAIQKTSNPVDVVKSNESVYVEAAGNSAGTVDTSTPATFTEITDSHGAWSGSTFTVPISGDYLLEGAMSCTASSIGVLLYKNGSSYRRIGQGDSGNNNTSFNASFRFVKGDLITIRTSTSKTLNNSTTDHWLVIKKIND